MKQYGYSGYWMSIFIIYKISVKEILQEMESENKKCSYSGGLEFLMFMRHYNFVILITVVWKWDSYATSECMRALTVMSIPTGVEGSLF